MSCSAVQNANLFLVLPREFQCLANYVGPLITLALETASNERLPLKQTTLDNLVACAYMFCPGMQIAKLLIPSIYKDKVSLKDSI